MAIFLVMLGLALCAELIDDELIRIITPWLAESLDSVACSGLFLPGSAYKQETPYRY